MSRVEVLIPWAAPVPDEHRAAALAYVRQRHVEHGRTVTLAATSSSRPWVKANAVNPAVRRSSAELLVVADADVWVSAAALDAAVDAVEQGAPWAMPHERVYRLTLEATRRVIAGDLELELDVDPELLDERPYRGVAGGGIVVARRETLLEVPFDSRFEGWGSEDQALGIALHALAGRAHCVGAPLWHLWHPPQYRVSRKIGSLESDALRRRYLAARRDPSRMRAIIAGA